MIRKHTRSKRSQSQLKRKSITVAEKMEYSFEDQDFEPEFSFLIDVLANCITNRIHGFIVQRNENFTVRFVFSGLKFNIGKRRANDEVNDKAKRMKTLNVSMENLLLDTNEGKAYMNVDVALTNIKQESITESSRGRKRTASPNHNALQQKWKKETKKITK